MKENNAHIIAHWLEGSVSDAELDSQYDSGMSADLKKICGAADDIEIPALNSQALLDRINKDISDTHKPSYTIAPKVFSLKYWWIGVAAIFLGIIVFTSLLDQSTTISNHSLEYVSHQLPDGSHIQINANSTIKYNEEFITDRTVELVGEAFFEVQKGSTFTVHTDNGNITVLGTSFNVFSRKEHLTVACKTGKVKVDVDKEYILTPGAKITSIRGRYSELSRLDIDKISQWTNGESMFSSSPLGEVLEAITAQYDYTLKGAPLDLNQKFTGSFIHDDIDKAVRMVFLPMGISYRLDTKNNQIIIQ